MTLEDIRRLVREDLPALSAQALPDAAPGLGRLAALRQWLADVQGRLQPAIRHPRAALFLSRHGFAAERQQGLDDLPAAIARPGHPLSAMAAGLNADLQVYELDLARASGDPAQGPALTEQDALQALAYGMMSVQPGVDALVLALPNPAARLAAQAIRDDLAQGADPLLALLKHGGFDIAAALGAAVAARLAKVPVLLDSSADVIDALLRAFSPDAAAHLRTAPDVIDTAAEAPAPGVHALLALALLMPLCSAAA